MKKLLKLLAVLAAVFVVLLIAAFITLKIMFPPEKIKTIAQGYAAQALQREVNFSDVSFNLIGVTLKDFAVSEKSSFAQGTFVKADEAVVKIALKPLFKKRIEIASVGLEGLDVNILKTKDGNFNFSDLLSETASSQPSETQEPQASSDFPFELNAQRIYAQDCNLYYKDLQSGMDASVTNLNLEIKNFSLNAPFDASLSFTTDYQDASGLNVTIPVQASATADLAAMDFNKARAALNNLTMKYKDITFTLWGEAKNFEKPDLELKGKISGVSNASLSDVLPDLPAFVLPDIHFSAAAQADLQSSSAVIKLAKLSLSDSFFSAKGSAGWGGAAPTYNLSAELFADMAQVANMAQMLSGYGIGGVMRGQFSATDKKDGQDVRGSLTMKDLTVVYDPLTLSGLNGTIVIKSLADVSCSSLTGKLNQAPFTSSFAYKDLGGVLDLLFHFDLSKLTLERFPGGNTEETAASQTADTSEEAAPEGPETLFNVKGSVKIGEISVPFFTTQGFELNADLKKASAAMKQANGSVKFVLQEGAVKDLDLFARENRIIKILTLPLTLVNKVTSKLGVEIFPAQKPEDKGKIKFSSGSGEYVFQNGLMTVAETHFNSSVSDMKASGTLNFKNEALNMRVSATVLTSQTPIVIKIGGTMSQPSGKLDVAGTAAGLVGGILNYKTPVKVAGTTANAAKSTAEAGATAVKDTVGAAVGVVKGIGGLFKKKDSEEKK